MVVTEQDLDALYGTDTPRQDPLTSYLDDAREDPWLEPLFDPRFDESEETDPAKFSLMQVDDFYDDVPSDPSVQSGAAPGQRTPSSPLPSANIRPVIRHPDQFKIPNGLFRALGLVLFVLIAGAVFWFKVDGEDARNTVAGVFKTTQELTKKLLALEPPPGEGFNHRNIKTRRTVRDGNDYLVIEGDVVNEVHQPVAVPMLRAALTNSERQEIRVLTQKLSKEQLHPGEKVTFKIEFKNPPGTARSMKLSFVNAAETKESTR
ncbi:DUF3426 domain-containing protein [Magnetovibrio blakemorei]|uniref:DUF3426 domain-containing protein n=1 Tax=Magnetovibrio blakemorei TaxID=28181 RepID=A0A1E5QC68_9PROT|nr:DUF3426 domain-containing protein [Magnetovibrio blakemorei]OEJ69635.1 hypothetical protein BEN30_02010 [Magnetovibrio blakemorei]